MRQAENNTVVANLTLDSELSTVAAHAVFSTIDSNSYRLSLLLPISLMGAFLVAVVLSYRWQSARERQKDLEKLRKWQGSCVDLAYAGDGKAFSDGNVIEHEGKSLKEIGSVVLPQPIVDIPAWSPRLVQPRRYANELLVRVCDSHHCTCALERHNAPCALSANRRDAPYVAAVFVCNQGELEVPHSCGSVKDLPGVYNNPSSGCHDCIPSSKSTTPPEDCDDGASCHKQCTCSRNSSHWSYKETCNANQQMQACCQCPAPVPEFRV